MKKTPPIIDGRTVDKHYDLDNTAHLLELGLDPNADLKIADSYDHYQHCKDAVIEYGSTLHKAIEQVESTIKRLLDKGKKVDLLIIVVKRLSRFEQRLFKRKPRDYILRERKSDRPRLIKVDSKAWTIFLFYSREVKSMYSGLNRYR
jgi:hypothetical protein